MTTLEALLAQPLGQALGWSLLHFLWQGTIIAGILAAVLALARNRSASLRYAMACGALLLMTAAPVVTFLGYEPAPAEASPETPREAVAFEQVAPGPVAPDVAAADLTTRFSAWWQERFTTLQPWMVLTWSLGVLLLSLRYLGGWAAAQRLKRRLTRPAPGSWQATLDRLAARLRITRPVRLLESAAVRVPSALGIWKPVVLVPAASLAGIAPRHLEALLAHELAHIRRHDYLVNLLQSAVETLLFYHPAVWWVSRRARVERENCCDDLAIAATGSASVFARALAELEERRASGLRLQTAADGGLLRRRVVRLLGGPERSEPFPRQVAGVLALSLLLLTGAAFRISSSDTAGSGGAGALLLPEPTEIAGNGLASGDPEDECADCEPSDGLEGGIAGGIRGGIAGGIEGGIRGGVSGGVRGAIRAVTAVVPTALAGAYDDVVLAQAATPREKQAQPAMPAEGKPSDRLTVDQLIAFKVHGVTPEFIAQVESLGFGRSSPDDLISLRVHGVDRQYIESVRRSWGNLDLEEIVSLKIHGLTPQFAEEMKKTGLSGLDFEELLAMKIHGVTPEYVRNAQASGFGKLDADQIVALKIHGVTSQDVEKWKSLGMAKPDFDQVVSAKIHGVTPEFVGEMRKLGFDDLDLDDVVSLRIHGVTPEFVAQVRAAGYTQATADEVTALRIHKISAEDVKAFKAAAPRLSLEDIVSLKIHGFSVEELRRMVQDGRLVVDEPDSDDEEN